MKFRFRNIAVAAIGDAPLRSEEGSPSRSPLPNLTELITPVQESRGPTGSSYSPKLHAPTCKRYLFDSDVFLGVITIHPSIYFVATGGAHRLILSNNCPPRSFDSSGQCALSPLNKLYQRFESLNSLALKILFGIVMVALSLENSTIKVYPLSEGYST